MVFVSTALGGCSSRKKWTENTTDSGPPKGSVVAPHTQRIRISLVFPDTCHKNPWCARRQYPETGQEYVVFVSTPLGSCSSRKSGQKNTTDSGPSKGSVLAQHTPRVRVSLVFPDPCHKNPGYVRQPYPENGQEFVVFVSTPLGSCGSRKSGQKTPRILVHQRVVSLHRTHQGFEYHSFFPTLATRILSMCDDSIQKRDKNSWCLCPLRWAAAAHESVDRKHHADSGPSKGSVVAPHTPRVRISLVFPDPCHKNPQYVRRQYPEKGQEFVVLVSTPLGSCGSRKRGQKTPRGFWSIKG